MNKIIFIAKDFGDRVNQKNLNAFAASTAFFLFLSLIPMLILLCAIIPYTPLTEGSLMIALTEWTPDIMHPMIVRIVNDVYDQSGGILSIAIIGTLWSAGKGMLALMRGLNVVNGVEENRNSVVLRIVASVYTIIILIVLLLSLFVMVFGNVFVSLTLRYVPQLSVLFEVLVYFRYLILWMIFTVGIALIYAYIPGARNKFRMQLPGALLASLAWIGVSFGFSIYIDMFNGFNTYGSLTTIIMVMIWLYIGMYIIMLGGYINKYFKPVYLYFGAKRKNKAGIGRN